MDPTIVAVIAAVAAPLGTYLVAARRFSGRIESSDAKELWTESRSIRDWSQQRIGVLNQIVARLEKKIEDCTDINTGLHEQINNLTIELAEAHLRIARLEANHRP